MDCLAAGQTVRVWVCLCGWGAGEAVRARCGADVGVFSRCAGVV